MSGEIPLQVDLFTGALVDTRTQHQKRQDAERAQSITQAEMFSQRDVAQFGVTAHPVMPFSPGRLQLLIEDPRTEEEIEQDRQRQAQALTSPLFTEAAPADKPDAENALVDETQYETLSAEKETDDAQDTNEDVVEASRPIPLHTPPSKYETYLTLVEAAEERAETLYNSPVSLLSETITMSKTKLEARLAGLMGEEIAAALTIGDFRGKAKSQPDQSNNVASPNIEPIEKEIPIMWTSRDDMLKRRPDLKEKIATLSEDELEYLSGLVGIALEEFYWIQLNFVLSLYLDHEMRILRNVKD